jgi:hypothetical protein
MKNPGVLATDEVPGDVGPLHFERASASGELRVVDLVGHVGDVVKRGVMEADEVAVLGRLHVGLDEVVGALLAPLGDNRWSPGRCAMLNGRDVCRAVPCRPPGCRLRRPTGAPPPR